LQLVCHLHHPRITPLFKLAARRFTMSESKEQITIQSSGIDQYNEGHAGSSSTHSLPKDAVVAEVQSSSQADDSRRPAQPADIVDEQKKGSFAYFRTKEFYITVILG
jgi:solute carrier family 35 protein F1/2